ncbi:uncharacterized protein LOC121404698 [Drosophila obscura]|uniref:uncharacterized protein LOC121404698 n=1 Tax=Drosophila obscura TaxID=7282 RepID=UPI001BB119A0|nr:uncharacterized protein LOC121404698 [Drosophila obscura]
MRVTQNCRMTVDITIPPWRNVQEFFNTFREPAEAHRNSPAYEPADPGPDVEPTIANVNLLPRETDDEGREAQDRDEDITAKLPKRRRTVTSRKTESNLVSWESVSSLEDEEGPRFRRTCPTPSLTRSDEKWEVDKEWDANPTLQSLNIRFRRVKLTSQQADTPQDSWSQQEDRPQDSWSQQADRP